MARNTHFVLLLLTSLAASSAIFAQTQPSPTTKPAPGATAPTAPAPTPRPAALVEFSDKPVRLESAGVSMKIPIGCNATSNTAVDSSTVQIMPEDSTWLMQIESPRSTRLDMSLKEVCDAMINQLMVRSARLSEQKVEKREGDVEFGKFAEAVRGTILERNDNLVITGWPAAARFYVETYPGDVAGVANLGVIRGFTVVKVASDRYVTFELKVLKPKFAEARVVYETAVATSTFTDPSTVQTGRKAALEGGLQILQRMDAAALRSMVENTPERWQRLFVPGTTGATADDSEIGYRRLRYSWGKRGALDAARKESQYTATERQEGVIVMMDARVLDIDPSSPSKKIRRVIDSASVYFMAPDRQQEAWTVRNAFRDGKTTSQITEIGSRNNTDMVVSVTANGDSQQVRPIIQGDFAASGYLSQAESRLLHQFLLAAKAPTEYGFYVWNSTSQAIKLRRDVLEQPKDAPGTWKITSRATEDSKPEIAIYNERGDLIRIELLNDSGDTMYWEPTELQTLLNIWKQKNLPIE